MEITLPTWEVVEIEGDSMTVDAVQWLIEKVNTHYTGEIDTLKTDYEKQINKAWFEARKSKKTATDATTLAQEAHEELEKLQAKSQFMKAHPWADYEAVEKIMSNNPNLNYDEAHILAQRRQSYGMEWASRSDWYQSTYNNEDFAKLTEAERDKVLDLAEAWEVTLDLAN